MAKGRKQVKRNKPVPRMCEKDVPKLGKNSNHKSMSMANQLAIYFAPEKKELPKLNPQQDRQLEKLKANLLKLKEKRVC